MKAAYQYGMRRDSRCSMAGMLRVRSSSASHRGPRPTMKLLGERESAYRHEACRRSISNNVPNAMKAVPTIRLSHFEKNGPTSTPLARAASVA